MSLNNWYAPNDALQQARNDAYEAMQQQRQQLMQQMAYLGAGGAGGQAPEPQSKPDLRLLLCEEDK